MILIILINHRFVNLWIDICVDKFLIHISKVFQMRDLVPTDKKLCSFFERV